MKFKILSIICILTLGCQNKEANKEGNSNYDLVISNVRIIDPETGIDSILNIGVKNETIQKLTTEKIKGSKQIDGTGKIACPGFIDLHSHSPFPFGESLQLRDGVTTILDLEAGAHPQSGYGEFLKDSARANYGSSVANYAIRIKVIEDVDQPYLITKEYSRPMEGPAFVQEAADEQIEEMRKLFHQGLDQGGLGIGLVLDYMSSAINDKELRMIFEVAAKRNAPIWAHIRRGVNGDINGLNEVLELSQELGAPLHICHINANAMGNVGKWLEAIDKANENGADISVELFPYTAGSTGIKADVFDRDWQRIFNITYEDVQWSETGEWFTKESWEEKRRTRPESFIIHHYMKEEWIIEGLRHPKMMVASDAMPALNPDIKGNPNTSGTFTRLLAKYVRDEKVLGLKEAIAKVSYYPAKRLEGIAPVFKKKGRIQEGADADILVFDLEDLKDHATYTDPYKPSTGWSYIIVNGTIAVKNDSITSNNAGKRITGFCSTPCE